MKISGVEITGDLAKPNEDVMVLPRGKGQIVFTAQAVLDLDEFEERVPKPKPKKNFHRGKGWIVDLEDETYVKEVEKYNDLRVAYYVVRCLQDIEWATVDLEKPATWLNWEKDFESVGFSQHERNLILQFVLRTNNLDERKLEQARELFVLGQEQEANESTSPPSEQKNSPSGELVNASE